MAPIAIDWREVLCDRRSSPDRGDVCFVSSSSSPATRARAGAAAAKGKRAQTRSGGLREDGAAGESGRRRRAGTGAGRQAAADARRHTPPAAHAVYEFDADDAKTEAESRRYCVKSSPLGYRKKNYGQLEMSSGRSGSLVGVGDRKPISVDKMYSSSPFSTTFSGQQQRVRAIDPEEADHGNFHQTQSYTFSNFTKRRKEQHHDSSSLYDQKVEDVVLLDDEDMQPEEKVDCVTPDKQIESKIYYPSRDDPEAVELSSSDIRCLEPGAFLSSPVINYYIRYIKRTKLPKEDKFYIFNTYFYSKLEEAFSRTSDFLKLRRWWKGVNIFQRPYIILPIHGMAHWSLIIICIPGKESNSGPIILHLDSLGMHRSNMIFGVVKRYLEEEWCHLKKNPPPDTSISESVWEDLPRNIHTEIVQVPQQNNAYDCGIFMLYYVERFVREAPERFTRDKLDMFSRSWFNSEVASELRLRIRELLLEEFESARLDDAISDTATSDGSDIEDIIKGGELEAAAPSDSSEIIIEGAESGENGMNGEGFEVAAAEGSGESGGTGKSKVGIIDVPGLDEVSAVRTRHDENMIDNGENDEGYKVAAAEGSGESAGTGKSNVGIAEVPALDEAPTGCTRHDEKMVDCFLSEEATFSDSLKDEDAVKAYSDSSKVIPQKPVQFLLALSDDEEEYATVSPDRLKSNEGITTSTSTPYPEVVSDSCDSDSDGVKIVEVRKRRDKHQNCWIS